MSNTISFRQPTRLPQRVSDHYYMSFTSYAVDSDYSVHLAIRNQRTLEGRPVSRPQTRKSFTREYSLEVVRFYRGNNLYQKRQTIFAQHQDHRTLGCRRRKDQEEQEGVQACEPCSKVPVPKSAYPLLGARFLTA